MSLSSPWQAPEHLTAFERAARQIAEEERRLRLIAESQLHEYVRLTIEGMEVIEQRVSRIAEQILQLAGKSQEIGATWCPRSADFIFVDGGHSYEDCYEDGSIWYNVLKSGGYMAFHDYGADMLAAIKPAVDAVTEMLGMQFVEHEGKLIVFRKPDENIPY